MNRTRNGNGSARQQERRGATALTTDRCSATDPATGRPLASTYAELERDLACLRIKRDEDWSDQDKQRTFLTPRAGLSIGNERPRPEPGSNGSPRDPGSHGSHGGRGLRNPMAPAPAQLATSSKSSSLCSRSSDVEFERATKELNDSAHPKTRQNLDTIIKRFNERVVEGRAKLLDDEGLLEMTYQATIGRQSGLLHEAAHDGIIDSSNLKRFGGVTSSVERSRSGLAILGWYLLQYEALRQSLSRGPGAYKDRFGLFMLDIRQGTVFNSTWDEVGFELDERRVTVPKDPRTGSAKSTFSSANSR